MLLEKAELLLCEIEQYSGSDTELMFLSQQMYAAAIRYARLRTDWFVAQATSRADMDGTRRLAHDVFIDSCNILSRAMCNRGKSIEWRQRLGQDRKEIGDFACWLHALLGIRAR